MLDFALGSLVLAGLYGIVAISLHLQAGMTGLMNFGMVGFFGIGVYSTAISGMHGMAWPVGIIIGMAVASVCGVGVGVLGQSLGAEYWAIATLALAELVRLIALNSDGFTNGTRGIGGITPFFFGQNSTVTSLKWFALIGMLVLAFGAIAIALGRTQFGRVARMVREHENLAASLGHNTTLIKIQIMAISAPMAAIGGSLFAHYISFIGPPDLAPINTFLVWTMAVVGGLGSVRGVVLGAIIVQGLYDSSRFLSDVFSIPAGTIGAWRILIIGLALLVFLLAKPDGLIPERLRTIDVSR